MKKVLIVTTSLDYGGITSFLIPLANTICSDNKVTVAYTRDNGEFLERFDKRISLLEYSPVNKKKHILHCIKNKHLIDLLKIKFRNKNCISPIASIQRFTYDGVILTNSINEKFDIAISSAEFFCNAYVAYKVSADYKIGWIHPDIKKLKIDKNYTHNLLNCLDKVVSVSQSGLDSLNSIFPEYQDKFCYIANMLNKDWILDLSEEEVHDATFCIDNINIVTVCRIDNSSKRLDRIIKTSVILKSKKAKFKWYIIGTGKDFQYINSLIEKNGLTNEVIMLGKKDNPYCYISKADLFILTSQYEGKPIVVDEAKLLKVPVIVTNYQSAFEQVNPLNGIVVENQDGVLENEIASIIQDKDMINELNKKAQLYRYSSIEEEEKIKRLLKS